MTPHDPSPLPEVSIVIPARNEELLIAGSIQSILAAVRACEITSELIVVNDASEDETAKIARDSGARVVDVALHNIGAVRNAGAAVATGRLLLFLDADTHLPTNTLRAILAAVKDGAVGGGAAVEFDSGITRLQRLLSKVFLAYWQGWGGWAAGCCVYVLRPVFEEIGGFDVQQFAAEERFLSDAIRKKGKFIIVKEPVETSARKLRLFSSWKLIKVAAYAILVKRWKLHNREGLGVFYDAPREQASGQDHFTDVPSA